MLQRGSVYLTLPARLAIVKVNGTGRWKADKCECLVATLPFKYDWSMIRKRLQIELGASEMVSFERIRGLGGNDAEVGRRAVSLLARLADAIDDGFTIAAVPPEESRFADAAPELTNAVAPERRYRHLVRARHPWRRQLSIKGRRMTVGQLVAQIRANDLSVAQAAQAFELSEQAVTEAIDYAERNAPLLAEESAEERRRVELASAASR